MQRLTNPFTAVSREEYQKLQRSLETCQQDLADKQREVAALAAELEREMRNGARLTDLCARAVASVETLEAVLTEHQIGKDRDPSMVLVVQNLPGAPKRRQGFIPLHKRRRLAVKKEEDAQVRRNALPRIKAELPAVLLTKQDRAVMRDAVAELNNS